MIHRRARGTEDAVSRESRGGPARRGPPGDLPAASAAGTKFVSTAPEVFSVRPSGRDGTIRSFFSSGRTPLTGWVTNTLFGLKHDPLSPRTRANSTVRLEVGLETAPAVRRSRQTHGFRSDPS